MQELAEYCERWRQKHASGGVVYSQAVAATPEAEAHRRRYQRERMRRIRRKVLAPRKLKILNENDPSPSQDRP